MIQNITLIQKIVVWILPLLFAITIHEVAHGWMASRLGDKTAQILGRLTLNPLRHIDLIGTIFVPILLLWVGGYIFGWARPVPINPRNFSKPRRDMALVSLAGPLSNFLMAIFWAFIMKMGMILMARGLNAIYPIILMGQAGIMINLVLMLLNLIPIPPLDGSRIISSLLPNRIAYQYERLEPYGFVILLLLLVTGLLNLVIGLPFVLLNHLISVLFGLF